MSAKRIGLLLAAVALVALLLFKRNLLVAVLIGAFVLATGRAVFRGYSTTKGPTGPPVDVDERGTLLVFACETCGEQLVLLRRGTDTPPRHCSEAMILRRVPTPSQDQGEDQGHGEQQGPAIDPRRN